MDDTEYVHKFNTEIADNEVQRQENRFGTLRWLY